MTEKMPDLLPCPFCGGKAGFAAYGTRYSVFCANPESEWNDHACHFKPELQHIDFDNKDEAFRAWNTRADLMPQWNEDMESAPHGVWLLITTEFGHVWQMCHHAKGYWLGQDNTIISRRPKAWMPLPTPPQSGEKEGE